MSPVRLLLAVALGAALLAGCADDPADERRAAVAALTEAANARDAAAVRTRAEELVRTLEAQRGLADVSSDEAERLIALVQAVRTSADAIDTALLERRKAEAEAEAANKQLEEAQRQLEEERRKAEERGKGNGKDDDEKDDD